MAGRNDGKGRSRERLGRWHEGALAVARGTRARVGRSGCAVGVLGIAFSAFWVMVLVRGPGIFGKEPADLYRVPVRLALPLVPFLICWWYPSLSRLLMVAMLALAATLFVMWAIFMFFGFPIF